MSISEAKAIVAAAIPDISNKQLKIAAAVYLNWWNGHSASIGYSDPTGEKAVRRILGYFDIEPAAA
ncbi:hypothetical protein [Brachybacterium subflavum]|uniref:hypothetical protein n=1 Tax=Brachybacterium subflavum TaxID=2585206 RepID=UPI001266089C|nr:hypothetical protein [Brachybacterium subflavum]